MINKKTLVIGASENEMRYSNMAIRSLINHGHSVVGIGSKKGNVSGVTFDKELIPFSDIDTITLYINPALQKSYYEYFVSLSPKRIIFNPGTENDELRILAKNNGIQPINACTLVMLNTGQY